MHYRNGCYRNDCYDNDCYDNDGLFIKSIVYYEIL